MVGYSYKPSEYTIANADNYIISASLPKNSDWQCQLFGNERGIVYTPIEGNEPNWFHRKMQELCFGFKWRKRSGN